MKLRLRSNTLRLRVNRREVEALAAGGILQEQVFFPGDARLVYTLESAERPAASATLSRNTIRIAAPRSDVQLWAGDNDSIGLYFDLPANGATLKISIEKDLECLDGPPEERDPEAFARISAQAC